MVSRACGLLRERSGICEVALSGGVWQNAALLARTVGSLRKNGFQVYLHQQVPPNDGGLALGQAVVAACRLRQSAA
jgi:hydrogenase maturation protein HypF